MVAQLRITKEVCIFQNCFHYFVHSLYMGSGFLCRVCCLISLSLWLIYDF